jgi:gamma-glutamylcyclotransferase (GGCT)/AIG2-like uncharacterized protein YtfP
MRLFVYGTLKRGEPRHGYLSGQTFIVLARTLPVYRLYDLGEYPGLVGRADGLAIEGELWEVDKACLEQLDKVEGCDDGLYCRSAVDLAPPHDGSPAVTYLYQKSVENLAECGTCW